MSISANQFPHVRKPMFCCDQAKALGIESNCAKEDVKQTRKNIKVCVYRRNDMVLKDMTDYCTGKKVKPKARFSSFLKTATDFCKAGFRIGDHHAGYNIIDAKPRKHDDSWDETLMSLALDRARTQVVRHLIQHFKPSRNSLNPNNLLVAASKQIEELTPLLVDYRDQDGNTALHVLVNGDNELQKRLYAVRLLLVWEDKFGAGKPLLQHVNQNGDSALHVATTYGEFCVFKKLVSLRKSSRDIAIADGVGNNAGHLACMTQKDSVKKVKCLMKNRLYYFSANHELQSLLHVAARSEHNEVLKPILDSWGIAVVAQSINRQDSHDRTPLHYACLENQIENVKLLLELRDEDNKLMVDINIPDANGDTPCHKAACGKHIEIVSLLKAHEDYNSNLRNKEGLTVADMISLNQLLCRNVLGCTVETIKKMLNDGAEPIVDGNGNTLLHQAVTSPVDAVRKTQYLAEQFPNIKSDVNSSQHRPVDLAVTTGDINLFKIVATEDDDINAKVHGKTLLHYAVQSSDRQNYKRVEDIMRDPAAAKVDTNATDDNGKTAAYNAINSTPKLFEAFSLIVQHSKTNVNARYDNGRTAAHYALQYDLDKLMDHLLTKPELDVNAEADDGSTPALLALQLNKTEALKELHRKFDVPESVQDHFEALSALYNDDFSTDDDSARTCTVDFYVDDSRQRMLKFELNYPNDYPSGSIPRYVIHAPWLGRDDKERLRLALNKIQSDSIDQPEFLTTLWLQEVEDFLRQIAPDYGPDLNQPDEEEGNVRYVNIYRGEPKETPKGGTFQGFLAEVESVDEVERVMERMRAHKKARRAKYRMYAYRLKGKSDKLAIEGSDDDGEQRAGDRLLHLLQESNETNVIVVVTRWKRDEEIGAERFHIITECARYLLEQRRYKRLHSVPLLDDP